MEAYVVRAREAALQGQPHLSNQYLGELESLAQDPRSLMGTVLRPPLPNWIGTPGSEHHRLGTRGEQPPRRTVGKMEGRSASAPNHPVLLCNSHVFRGENARNRAFLLM